MSLILAAALATGPLAVVVVDGFDLHGWSVSCANVDSDAAQCNARRDIRRGCLQLHFDSREAYVELLPKCSDAGGPREPIQLPLENVFGPTDPTERLLSSNRIDPKRILTEQFTRELRYVSMFMFKLTNG